LQAKKRDCGFNLQSQEKLFLIHVYCPVSAARITVNVSAEYAGKIRMEPRINAPKNVLIQSFIMPPVLPLEHEQHGLH
jgi:hypothetical protein